MSYSSVIEYLYTLQKHGIKLGLDTMTALVGRLGMPQARYRTLHIAGTNGKGSTAAMTAAMVQAGGHRVGLYTSPHLVEFGERIRVNGRMIRESEIARLTQLVKGVSEPDLSPTFFEFTTAMAFQYFAESQIDVAVLEVGLGGRFDATNVVQPIAGAITTIAFDHQQHLGNTLAQIAFEKAGIIKPGMTVVAGALPPDAMRIVRHASLDRGATLLEAADAPLNVEMQDGRARITVETPGAVYGPLRGFCGRSFARSPSPARIACMHSSSTATAWSTSAFVSTSGGMKRITGSK